MEFNTTQLDNLEKHERHLSILATVIVIIMASGVALFMYPVVFAHPAVGNEWPMRFAYIGFCILSVLLVAYMLERQRTIGKLKQSLVAELKRNLELRHQASSDLLHSLPDINHFQDRLMMEFRRASNMEQPLSLLVVRIKLAARSSDKSAETETLGEAARAISLQLRPTDSIYVFGGGLFGVVLSETNTAKANKIKSQIEDKLRIAGSNNKFSFETHLWNYPDHVKTAHEFDEHVASLLPETALVGKF